MNIMVNEHNVLIIILVSFISSLVLVPIAKKVAHHTGAIDIPNERKVHKKPMPRMGGLGIFGAFVVGYMFFADTTPQMLSILLGGFLIIMLGLFDDIKPIKALPKFIVQTVAACIIVFYGNMLLTDISILGFDFVFPESVTHIITIFFIVAITNAINLIDGLDGLAAGVSSIYFATIAIIALILNQLNGLDVILAVIMLGSTLGFLVYNFNPASVFMGDSGSLFLGYMIAVISLLGFKTATLTSLLVPILILSIPIVDTLLAIGRRLIKGESIGAPDKDHFHHQLLKMKFSTRVTVILIYCINICFSAVSIFYVIGDGEIALIIYIFLMIMLLFLVLKTNILFKAKEEKSKNKKLK